jgi:hypothetical protein
MWLIYVSLIVVVKGLRYQPQGSNALSFYRSKIHLDRPNNFGGVPVFLDGSNLFSSGPNYDN